MLGRKNRFHGYNSVLTVYARAQTVRADGCSLHYKINDRRRDYRLSVVVSKKVSKSAVQRNRIRRRIFEIVRQSAQIDKPYDLIITVFDAGLADEASEKITKTIQSLLTKSGISSR